MLSLKAKLDLSKVVEAVNVAELLDREDLVQIGTQVIQEYEIDKASRKDWEDLSEQAMKFAKQVVETKNTPWENASNVKYPLIATAAIQFNARAYPELIKGTEVVKTRVVGQDPDGSKKARGERVSKHMSYQLTEEMKEWEADMDRLLLEEPIVGSVFKKTYFDPVLGRNVSKLVHARDCVFNQKAQSWETLRRITHVMELYKNDIIERQRRGTYLPVDIQLNAPAEGSVDEQAPHVCLEQHRWLDLDGDQYDEPYSVLVHKETQEVLRIAARFRLQDVQVNEKSEVMRIEPTSYFTKFGFLPDPDGGLYDLGFGQLLFGINDAMNTAFNQVFDAGKLSNAGGGLASKDLKLKGGTISVTPGVYKLVDVSGAVLRDGIFPWPKNEPSPVLFNLLGFLSDAGNRLASVAEIMTGEQSGANVPATTTLAMIEQGLKVFGAIYKRVLRSLTEEYRKLYALNAQYLEDVTYFRVLDEENVVARADYEQAGCDVIPVADPNSATDVQRMFRAEATMKLAGAPGIDDWELVDEYLHSMKIPEDILKKIHPEEKKNPPAPPPDPKLIEVQEKIAIEKERLAMEKAKSEVEIRKMESEIVLNMARAEAAEAGPQIEYYKAMALTLGKQVMDSAGKSGMPVPPGGENVLEPGGSEGLAQPPGNGAGLPMAPPEGAGMGMPELPPGDAGSNLPGGGEAAGGAAGPPNDLGMGGV